MSQTEANGEARLQAALVDLLYRQSYGAMIASIVVPWPVVYVLWGTVAGPLLLTWAAAIYALTGARWLLSRRYFQRASDSPGFAVWARRFTLLSILWSLAWGALGWIGFVPTQAHLVAFVCIVLTGMSGGGVSSVAAHPPAHARVLLAMHAPFALRCLMQDDPVFDLYLVLQACLIVVSLYYCRVNYRSLKETVGLRFENAALIDGLKHERDRATAANHAKTRFLAAANHDLRQPIHALGLFAAALAALARKGDVRASDAQGLAEKQQAVIASLGGLLHGLIDVSRLDAGLVSVERRPIALMRLIQGLREEFGGQARDRGITLRAVPSNAWVESDPALLKRILDNFLSNALRYAPGGRVLIGCRRRGDRVEIQVVDTGPGIPADQHAAVFEEFTQLHNPHRDRQEGLGLGLAIVRRLAGLLGHPIALSSLPGKGSTFSLTVPLVAAPAVQPAPAPQHVSEGLGIMVVDDDLQVLDAITALMASWGHRSYAAPSVDALCRRHDEAGAPPVDLIIADHRLAGGMTGAAAIESLIGHLGYHAPALIVTGDTSPERLRDLAASGHVLLHKPLAPDLLQDAIRRAVGEPLRANGAG
ncbi:hybrid sensor histidine kinase/response regulator [Phreatobacter stygius]|uniref:histidine kinase n=1 Tax=Phreatobacter stygius TaxID=1940610 RepID=A0A4D7BCR8_9HYPH|nr:hybrid sensor histidine kinase/response regulator [Phreatobacter stygius]QCI68640.1 hybrid sensor histidine kinase/response regulator [Phreatobacter stygius]